MFKQTRYIGKNTFYPFCVGIKGFLTALKLLIHTLPKIYPLTDFQSLFFLLPQTEIKQKSKNFLFVSLMYSLKQWILKRFYDIKAVATTFISLKSMSEI